MAQALYLEIMFQLLEASGAHQSRHLHVRVQAHYARWRATGTAGQDPIRELTRKRTCTVKGCDRKVQAKGYCPTHYQRWRRFGVATGADIGTRGVARWHLLCNPATREAEQ